MRTFTRVALAAMLALAAAACGGDDSTAETEDTDTTEPSGASDDGGGDGGTDADVAGLLGDDCAFLLSGAFLNPLAAAVPGGDVDFGDTSAQLEAIAEAAPDEIQDAMATIADRFAQFAEALEGVDFSDPQAFADPEVQAALDDVEDIFDDEYEAAGQAVNDYVEENCSG